MWRIVPLTEHVWMADACHAVKYSHVISSIGIGLNPQGGGPAGGHRKLTAAGTLPHGLGLVEPFLSDLQASVPWGGLFPVAEGTRRGGCTSDQWFTWGHLGIARQAARRGEEEGHTQVHQWGRGSGYPED